MWASCHLWPLAVKSLTVRIDDRTEAYVTQKRTGGLIMTLLAAQGQPRWRIALCSIAGANAGHHHLPFCTAAWILISQRIPPIQLRAIKDPKDLSRAAADVAPGRQGNAQCLAQRQGHADFRRCRTQQR